MGNPRGKVSTQACEKCRQRKRKCDSVKPFCGPCVRLGQGIEFGEDNNLLHIRHYCVYQENFRKRGPKNQQEKSIQQIRSSILNLRESIVTSSSTLQPAQIIINANKQTLPFPVMPQLSQNLKSLNSSPDIELKNILKLMDCAEDLNDLLEKNNYCYAKENITELQFVPSSIVESVESCSSTLGSADCKKSVIKRNMFLQPKDTPNNKAFNYLAKQHEISVIPWNNTIDSFSIFNKDHPIFDFTISHYMNPIIPNPLPTYSFISEIDTEESLKHFLNNNEPVIPESNTMDSAYVGESTEIALYSHLHKAIFEINAFFLAIIKSRFRKQHLLKLYGGEKLNTEELFQVVMSEMKDHDLYINFGLGCLRSRHHLLFTEQFGGSPQNASLMFTKMASDSLKTASPEDIYTIVYIEIKLQNTAILFNYDKPDPNNKLQSQYSDIEDKFARKIIWARLLELGSMTIPLIGNEIELEEYTSEEEWEFFRKMKRTHHNPNIQRKALITSCDVESNKRQTSESCKQEESYDKDISANLHFSMQMCFLFRRVVRFNSVKANNASFSVFGFTDIEEIHNKHTQWHDIVLGKNFRIFKCLSDFLFVQGIRNFDTHWKLRLYNIQLNVWYLWSLIKLHAFQTNPHKKFKFTPLGSIEGTSMDVILCCVRALSSILLINLPDEKKLEMKLIKHANKEVGYQKLEGKKLPRGII
ncbi:hypothetical protein HDU92_002402 [Lobulomyces angularis]|nr:hypothetical protein HDU92_002402 [Lobulomyces angularis]